MLTILWVFKLVCLTLASFQLGVLTILSNCVSLLPVFNLVCWLFCQNGFHFCQFLTCRVDYSAGCVAASGMPHAVFTYLMFVRKLRITKHWGGNQPIASNRFGRKLDQKQMKNWKLVQKQDVKTDQKLGTGPKKDAKGDCFQTKAVLLSINMPLCVSSQLHSMYTGTYDFPSQLIPYS